jgi:hypothetical protein
MGRSRFLPFGDRVDRDCHNVQQRRRGQRIPQQAMQIGDQIQNHRRYGVGQRPFIGHVIVVHDAGERPPEQEREQEEHHPATGRVMADLHVGFAAEQARKMPGHDVRGSEEPREPRGVTPVPMRTFGGPGLPVCPHLWRCPERARPFAPPVVLRRWARQISALQRQIVDSSQTLARGGRYDRNWPKAVCPVPGAQRAEADMKKTDKRFGSSRPRGDIQADPSLDQLKVRPGCTLH